MRNGEHREEIQALQDAAQIKALGGYGASMSVSAHRKEVADMERQAPDIMKNRDATLKRIEDLRAEQERLTGGFGLLQAIAPTRDEEDRSKKASDIQDQIQQLQKMLEDAEAATKRSDLHAGKEETDRIRARFFGTHDGMEKAYADAKKDVERLQKQLLEPDKPLTKAQAQSIWINNSRRRKPMKRAAKRHWMRSPRARSSSRSSSARRPSSRRRAMNLNWTRSARSTISAISF